MSFIQIYMYRNLGARELYIRKYKVSRLALGVFEPEFDNISKALTILFKDLIPQAYYFRAFIENHNDLI